MNRDVKVAIIGMDTSHSVEFCRCMQGADCPADLKVEGMRAVSCLRFLTPFCAEQTLDERQEQLEKMGVKVTTAFDEAVSDCDALMLEITDPAYHLEYFSKCVDLGKPMFLDKPLADTLENGRKICGLAMTKKARVFSASSLRFVPQFKTACAAMPAPLYAGVYGPLKKPASGGLIAWFGVHVIEMLQRALGRGVSRVYTWKSFDGVVIMVEYGDDRRGIAELSNGVHYWGGCLRNKEQVVPYVVDMTRAYTEELIEISSFFHGMPAPLDLEDTLEVMRILDAAESSLRTGRAIALRS